MVGEDMRRVVRDSDGEKRVGHEEGEGWKEGDSTEKWMDEMYACISR